MEAAPFEVKTKEKATKRGPVLTNLAHFFDKISYTRHIDTCIFSFFLQFRYIDCSLILKESHT